jgi:uncharacterized protein YkwD
LVVSGVVISAEEACRSRVPVVVKRDGVRVAEVFTDDVGTFKTRLKDRPGRYRAIAVATASCDRAKAASIHSHRVSSAGLDAGTGEVTASASSSCWTFRPSEMEFARVTDVARTAAGVPSLKLDPELSKVARVHTRDMVAAESLVHSPSDQLGSRVTTWSRLGENIAVGQGVDALQDAFMRSTAHRANILEKGFANVGVGTVLRDGRLWVTIIFQGAGDPGTTLRMPTC